MESTHKAGVVEWVLKRAAGDERGTAMYGDLVELRPERGGAWFWMAYARTLVALMWRTPVAFAVGGSCFVAFYQIWVWMHGLEFRYFWRADWYSHPYVHRALTWIVFELWFVLPYSAIRFGAHDRLVRLTSGAALTLTCALLIWPTHVGAFCLAAIGLLLAFGSIFFADWRGAGTTLIAAITAGSLVLYSLFFFANIGAWYYMKHGFGPHFELFSLGFALPHSLFWILTWSIIVAEMAVLALVSARLHRRFVGRKEVATA